jgi:hypothetical protein
MKRSELSKLNDRKYKKKNYFFLSLIAHLQLDSKSVLIT